jgi:hypothetical protein
MAGKMGEGTEILFISLYIGTEYHLQTLDAM